MGEVNKVKGQTIYRTIALLDKSSQLVTGVTCHTASHSVTCLPTHLNTTRLTPARQAGTVLNLRTPEGWKTELTADLGDCLDTEIVYPSANSRPFK